MSAPARDALIGMAALIGLVALGALVALVAVVGVVLLVAPCRAGKRCARDPSFFLKMGTVCPRLG
jgi:hypothetical protein